MIIKIILWILFIINSWLLCKYAEERNLAGVIAYIFITSVGMIALLANYL